VDPYRSPALAPPLTIFACPKPFTGATALAQRNAIRSWAALRPPCQVVLVADEAGTREAAAEHGVEFARDVARSERGTPLVNDVFRAGDDAARSERLCYVNADIVLFDDLVAAAARALAALPNALLVGRRTDLRVDREIDSDAMTMLRAEATRHGRLHGPSGIDYFVFPKGAFADMPPFAIGRFAWDNWILYDAKRRAMPIVDLTSEVVVVHQDHGYEHHPGGREGILRGPEARANAALIGDGVAAYARAYTIRDATHRLTPHGVRPNRTLAHAYRALVARSERVSALRIAVGALRAVRRLVTVDR
jgi:hypothetical protein